MKRQLTAEQIQARDARRAKFKALWKQVSEMPEAERLQLANKAGIITCDGHALSPRNQCLIMLQLTAPSIVGGFRQWLKHGRAVRKGEHGAAIYVPCTPSKKTENGETESTGDTFFTTGYVFDIGQTDPAETSQGSTAQAETEAA